MERIEQQQTNDFDVIKRGDYIYIEQADTVSGELDHILIEKYTIQALIAALQKHIE